MNYKPSSSTQRASTAGSLRTSARQTTKGWRTPVEADGAGFPDIVLVRERVVFVELKAERGKLSAHQERWRDALLAADAEWHEWRPSDWDNGTIQSILNARRRRPLTDQQREFIDGLRNLADWLEEHPHYATDWNALAVDVFVDSTDALRERARELGGWRDKQASGGYVVVSRSFGPHKVSVNISRSQVCERVVTGTRVVPAQPERVEEIVEWRCPDNLLAS